MLLCLNLASRRALLGCIVSPSQSSGNLANSIGPTTINCVASIAAKVNGIANNFRSLLITSFAVATLSFGLPFLALPSEAAALKFSLLLALFWIGLTIFSFVKYRWRALWCLFGIPRVAYWFVVLYLLASACAQNIRNCP